MEGREGEEGGEVVRMVTRTASSSSIVMEGVHRSSRTSRSPVITNGNIEPLSSDEEGAFDSETQPFVHDSVS